MFDGVVRFVDVDVLSLQLHFQAFAVVAFASQMSLELFLFAVCIVQLLFDFVLCERRVLETFIKTRDFGIGDRLLAIKFVNFGLEL